MKLLLDTHILLWAAADIAPPSLRVYLEDESDTLLFSAASIWEIVIKRQLGRPDFLVDPNLLYRGLIDNGYEPLSISAEHALLTATLPAIHKDPFDRILLAQSIAENAQLITADGILTAYPAPVLLIKDKPGNQ